MKTKPFYKEGDDGEEKEEEGSEEEKSGEEKDSEEKEEITSFEIVRQEREPKGSLSYFCLKSSI